MNKIAQSSLLLVKVKVSLRIERVEISIVSLCTYFLRVKIEICTVYSYTLSQIFYLKKTHKNKINKLLIFRINVNKQ